MKPILAVTFVLLLAAPTFAQQSATPGAQPASAADINRLVEAMHIKKNMVQMQRTMIEEWVDNMSADALKTLAPQQRQRFQAIMKDMMKESLAAYPPDEMIQDMFPIYQKHLDKSDVEALVHFYSSPSGQKFLDSQPKIMSEFMAVMMPKLQERMQGPVSKMQERVRAMAAEDQAQPAQDKDFKPATPAPK